MPVTEVSARDTAAWPELDAKTRRRVEAQLVFRSALLQVGRFSSRPGDPDFHCSGPPGQHVFVFPRTSVRIRHAGAEPFVTDRRLVTFYNPRQLYFREAVSPDGDECDWFSLRPDVVADVACEADPETEPGSPEPFRHASGPCDTTSYLMQRALLAAIQEGALDPAPLEEAAMALLARLVRAARSAAARAATTGVAARDRRALAEAARAHLGLRFDRRESLDDLARNLGCSVGHLCRAFRSHTGHSLHAHREELRLRASLDRVLEPGSSLSDLAHGLGFASHSHFTAAFRRRFGVTPSQLRDRGTPAGTRLLAARPREDAA